jgi:hypothetical protein
MATLSPLMQKAFEASKKKDEEKKSAEERKANAGSFEFENAAYMEFSKTRQNVFRIYGNPIVIREKATDPKLVMFSKLVKDDGKKYANIKWKHIDKDGDYRPDPDWILTKLYDKVNEGSFVKYTEEDISVKDGIQKNAEGKIVNKKGRNVKFVKKHVETQVFKRIDTNPKPLAPRELPQKVYPSKCVVMNVLDRHDSWCKDNLSAKIATRNLGVMEKTDDKGVKTQIYFPECGIALGTYDQIYNYVVKYVGDFSFKDIVLWAEKEGEQTKYKVADAEDEKYLTDDAKALVNANELTPEEQAYKLYDLDKIYGPTSYHSLKKNLIGLFKLCDVELGTSFAEELEVLVKEEEASREAAKKAKEEADKAKGVSTPEVKSEAPKAEEPKKERKPSTPSSSPTIEDDCAGNFTKWAELPENDKVTILTLIDKFDGSVAKWKNGSEELPCSEKTCFFKGTQTPTNYPESVSTCPNCGAYAEVVQK